MNTKHNVIDDIPANLLEGAGMVIPSDRDITGEIAIEILKPLIEAGAVCVTEGNEELVRRDGHDLSSLRGCNDEGTPGMKDPRVPVAIARAVELGDPLVGELTKMIMLKHEILGKLCAKYCDDEVVKANTEEVTNIIEKACGTTVNRD